MKAFIARYKEIILLTLIIILALFLRIYKLGEIPLGMNSDETAIGYNAYSILQTGKDEYEAKMPLYFRSFDDYKLPVYIYMTVLSEKVFGVNAFAVRFGSMLFGVITVLYLFFLIKELSKRSDLALLTSFLWAVNPWNIFFSRVSYEVNVATALSVLGALFFVKAIQKNAANYFMFFLSLFFFVLSLYCYNVARLVSPLILGTLILLNYKKFFRFSRLFLISYGAVFVIFLLPFILTLTSQSGLQNQQNGVFITGLYEKANFLELRSYFFHLPSIINVLFFNKIVLITLTYLKNVFGFFSVDFFFINGESNPINGIVGHGMFYFVELVFILTGLYLGIKKRVKYLLIFYIWLIVVILLNALTVRTPHATRSYMAIIPMIIFSAYGFFSIIEYLCFSKKKITASALVLLLLIFIYSVLYFLGNYFLKFPVQLAKTWKAEDRFVIEFVSKNQTKYSKIIFDKKADINYMQLLFYAKYSPQEYQANSEYQKNGLLNILARVGKFEYRDIDWGKACDSKKSTLFVTDSVPHNNCLLVESFYLPTRPVVIVIDENIISYPYKELVYQAFEAR
jgi:4-amino-4-deoxy-L-arabinose transferase-like glycosyltransferase